MDGFPQHPMAERIEWIIVSRFFCPNPNTLVQVRTIFFLKNLFKNVIIKHIQEWLIS